MTKLTRRAFAAATLAAVSAPGRAHARPRYDAVIGDATPDAPGFSSLPSAFEMLPPDMPSLRILVRDGIWRDKVVIDRPNVTLIGEGVGKTIMTFDDSARTLGADGNRIGTFGSYSTAIRAPGFSARGITFENAFDYNAAARAAAAGDQQAAGGLQAVALALAEGSDRARFEDCEFLGFQDTLYVRNGRAHFRNCRIAGTVDFIFGGGQALFETCEIVSRLRPDSEGRQGWISAASTKRDQQYGLVFHRCRLTREEGVAPNSVGLGRFWRPTTDFPDGRYGDPDAVGSSAFITCWMDDHIAAEGWDPMGYNVKGGTRSELQPRDARPAEYGSRGPGAMQRAFQLTRAEAARFAPSRILAGWRA